MTNDKEDTENPRQCYNHIWVKISSYIAIQSSYNHVIHQLEKLLSLCQFSLNYFQPTNHCPAL